jgi:hypothetical protein
MQGRVCVHYLIMLLLLLLAMNAPDAVQYG